MSVFLKLLILSAAAGILTRNSDKWWAALHQALLTLAKTTRRVTL